MSNNFIVSIINVYPRLLTLCAIIADLNDDHFQFKMVKNSLLGDTYVFRF